MGEAPNRPSPDDAPFSAKVPGTSGPRLARLLGVGAEELHRLGWVFVNLYPFSNPQPWSDSWAADRALAIEQAFSGSLPVVFVLCGRKVAKAFGFGAKKAFRVVIEGNKVFALIPHPSGRCRVWNNKNAVKLLRHTLNEAGVTW